MGGYQGVVCVVADGVVVGGESDEGVGCVFLGVGCVVGLFSGKDVVCLGCFGIVRWILVVVRVVVLYCFL